jgi:DHA1 family tetracycline resistance protein-like MFS transporter
MIGLILTTFSFFQFLSAPVMGKLSDTYGRRPLLILSQLSTMIGFAVLGIANSLWIIFLSRAIDGILGSNYTIAQAYISDVTDKKDRSKAFSISGMAFGVGFLIGPATGGYLSQFGYHVPAFLAAFISAISILLTYFYLPETVTKDKQRRFKLSEIRILDTQQFKKYLTHPVVGPALWELLFYLLAHFIWTSSFAVYGGIKLGLDARVTGYVLAFIGLISLILRMGVIPWLIDRFSEKNLTVVGMLSIMFGLVFTTTLSTIPPLFAMMAVFAFGAGLIRPLIMGVISRGADDRGQGEVMGISSSLGSIAQIIGPIFGGWLLSTQYPDLVLYVSASIMAAGLILFLKNRQSSKIHSPN